MAVAAAAAAVAEAAVTTVAAASTDRRVGTGAISLKLNKRYGYKNDLVEKRQIGGEFRVSSHHASKRCGDERCCATAGELWKPRGAGDVRGRGLVGLL